MNVIFKFLIFSSTVIHILTERDGNSFGFYISPEEQIIELPSIDKENGEQSQTVQELELKRQEEEEINAFLPRIQALIETQQANILAKQVVIGNAQKAKREQARLRAEANQDEFQPNVQNDLSVQEPVVDNSGHHGQVVVLNGGDNALAAFQVSYI